MKKKEYLVDEFGYICNFAKKKDFDFSVYRRQLKDLWTVYCVHREIRKDSPEVDKSRFLYHIWNNIKSKENADWVDDSGTPNYEVFRSYMCGDLE